MSATSSGSSIALKWSRAMGRLFEKPVTQDLSRRILNLYGGLTKIHDPEFALLVRLADPEVDNLGDPNNDIAKLFGKTWETLDQVATGSVFLPFSPERFDSFMRSYFEAYESINGTHKRARTALGVSFGKLTDKSEDKLRSFVSSVIHKKRRHLRALIWSMEVMLRQKRTIF